MVVSYNQDDIDGKKRNEFFFFVSVSKFCVIKRIETKSTPVFHIMKTCSIYRNKQNKKKTNKKT